jgi:caffeoyl-CoA O-methyltransferase
MKHGLGKILRLEQEEYLGRILPPRDPILREMEEIGAREEIPVSDPEVGKLLSLLVRATGARRILEVGTAIGYSTLCLTRGSEEAHVVSIDIDPERQKRAHGFLARAGVAGRVEMLTGAALDILAQLSGPFDFAYIDAVKTEYRRYLDLILPLLRVGGTIVVDNLLWSGAVAGPPAGAEEDDEPDENTEAIRAFNPYFMIHPQLTATIMAVGDGVGLATKTKLTMREQGGPY